MQKDRWAPIINIAHRDTYLPCTVVANFQNEDGTDESGGNFEIVYNDDKVIIGATFSLSYGFGYDLPIDYESNYDICHTDVLKHFDGKKFVWDRRRSEHKDKKPKKPKKKVSPKPTKVGTLL